MSLGLDDRLLGEKVHNYCSSSEEEDDDEESGSGDEETMAGTMSRQNLPPPEIGEYEGHCTNTGPKGVVTDWQRYKQLETERRAEQEAERLQLAKKLTLTCRSYLDEEKAKAEDEKFMENIENEFEDEFLKEYRRRRVEEMRAAFSNMPRFGRVISLIRHQYLEAIDSEKPCVTVVVHIYKEDVRACAAMNGCLMCLAQEYPTVKFCKILASETSLSLKFAARGVPALLIYKNKELIGNFIRVSDELGDDFFATDVEEYLIEHGLLPDKTLESALLQNIRGVNNNDDTDSDFDVD
ncbi:hypothetical protein LSH36_178g06007 [Paralvinella palmiformis]|uniref:Phosducin domain-containing protein n=1 Tax=Paralvinella palmiformis TaxID=53620 RepID=A0AAD9JSE9_9ANNE|nr:hypothetical protein LSH36_178g06007 [Paralvinella palmiformis]